MQQAKTPDWITALPGYQPDQEFNHFEIAGTNWQQNCAEHGDFIYATQPSLDPAIGCKRTLRLHRDEASFKWESALWITPKATPQTRIVRGHGQADTLEAAAAAALTYCHETIEVRGTLWHADMFLERRLFSTQIEEELVEVEERADGRWEWSRAVDLSGFRAAGLPIYTQKLEGEAPTAIDSMIAALDAHKALRRACRDYLCAGGQLIVSDYVPALRPMYRAAADQLAAH